jgi:FAD dependent oxidoreductase
MQKYVLSIFLTLFTLPIFSQDYIETDVLVIGGGASGVTASIQAARLNVKTVLVEETTWLGGMLTSAGVSATDGNHNMPSGIWKEFRDQLRKYYGGEKMLQTGWVSNTLFEPSVGNEIFKNMVLDEKNLKILYETKFFSLKRIKADRNIIPNIESGWEVSFKNKLKKSIKIRTRILIDATELGDVAKAAGVKYRIGTDDSAQSGELGFASQKTDVIQDLSYCAILKDYGSEPAPLVAKPVGYNAAVYDCSCKQSCVSGEAKHNCDKMLSYGKLPKDKYMINWRLKGNDYYANVIDADEKTRQKAFEEAKKVTLGFVYFIQNELGYKNLGLADDEFPTKDRLPLMPYHRESRRIEGVVTLNVNHIMQPFETKDALYRTGIAVGDYPLDHHHEAFKGTQPKLNLPEIPSFNVPLGSLIPKEIEDFIVIEKSISVSNIVNGATRLQPCVLLIGQAAGVLASESIKQNRQPKEVNIRRIQSVLLEKQAYLMPYYDIKPDHKYFKVIQRIGATGLLRGRGESQGWANRTWFDPDTTIRLNDLKRIVPELEHSDILPNDDDGKNTDYSKPATVEETLRILWRYGFEVQKHRTDKWNDEATFRKYVLKNWGNFHLKDYAPTRPIKRLEIAILLDDLFDSFNNMDVDMKGHFLKK